MRNLSYAQKRLIYENAKPKPRFGARPTWGWEAHGENYKKPVKRVVKRRKRK